MRMWWVVLLFATGIARAEDLQLGVRAGVHSSELISFDDDSPGGVGPAFELEGGLRSGRVSLTAFGTYLRFRDRRVTGINTDVIYDERVDVITGGGRLVGHVGMAVFGGGLAVQSARRRDGEFDGRDTSFAFETIGGLEIEVGSPDYKITIGGALTIGKIGSARAMLGFQWH
jgi:hypothetical protein